jgi:hypothetical protein
VNRSSAGSVLERGRILAGPDEINFRDFRKSCRLFLLKNFADPPSMTCEQALTPVWWSHQYEKKCETFLGIQVESAQTA